MHANVTPHPLTQTEATNHRNDNTNQERGRGTEASSWHGERDLTLIPNAKNNQNKPLGATRASVKDEITDGMFLEFE